MIKLFKALFKGKKEEDIYNRAKEKVLYHAEVRAQEKMEIIPLLMTSFWMMDDEILLPPSLLPKYRMIRTDNPVEMRQFINFERYYLSFDLYPKLKFPSWTDDGILTPQEAARAIIQRGLSRTDAFLGSKEAMGEIRPGWMRSIGWEITFREIGKIIEDYYTEIAEQLLELNYPPEFIAYISFLVADMSRDITSKLGFIPVGLGGLSVAFIEMSKHSQPSEIEKIAKILARILCLAVNKKVAQHAFLMMIKKSPVVEESLRKELYKFDKGVAKLIIQE